MAKNPMQRKAQNSFLLGMLITLLITGIIIALLFMQLTKVNKEMKQAKLNEVTVSVLKADVKSGQVITDDLITEIKVNKNTVPSNSFGNDASNIDTYRLEDVNGNPMVTINGEMALNIKDIDGKLKNRVVIQGGDNYYLLDETETKNYVFINEEGQLYIEAEDLQGNLVVDAQGNTKKCIIEKSENNEYYYTGNYYYVDTSEATNQNADTQTPTAINTTELKLTKVPVVAKVELKKNTVITNTLIVKSDEQITKDIRKVEYNMIVLPSQLETDKYIDIRLRLPNGADYTVVTRKRVTIPEVDGVESLSTISMNLSEIEILTLSCAIVESYKIEGSLLYTTEYVEPGLQEDVIPTYVPDNTTIALIQSNPNCVNEARQALFNRLYEKDENGNTVVKNSTTNIRQPINNNLNANAEDATDNVVDRLEEELQKSQEERQKYLESLGN